MTRVAVVYHSAFGHTEALARSVAQGISDAGGKPDLVSIVGLADDFDGLVERAGRADAIIFGAPTYMGDVSAPMKAFLDATSKPFAGQDWADRFAAGFTVSHSWSGDKLHALQTLAILAMQQGMIWVGTGLAPAMIPAAERGPGTLNRLGSWLGAMAQADNAPAEVTPPEGDKETARLLGVRVTGAAARWARGSFAADRPTIEAAA